MKEEPMKILIDDKKLENLLLKKRQYIGNKVTIDSIISALSFLISVLLASYDMFGRTAGLILKIIFVTLGVVFSVKCIYEAYKAQKHPYTYQDLIHDINEINEMKRPHSLIVIKDTFSDYPNRYLVYFDTGWNCLFFPNYKENINNENFITSHLSSDLKIPPEHINFKFLAERVSSKYSETAKEDKVYSHKFYLSTILEFPERLKQNSFEIDGITYCWKTLAELEQDPEVQKKNSDILGFVKALA